MINAVDISPLNTANKIHYKCKSCGTNGEFLLENSINTDKDGKIAQDEVFECPKCNKKI